MEDRWRGDTVITFRGSDYHQVERALADIQRKAEETARRFGVEFLRAAVDSIDPEDIATGG